MSTIYTRDKFENDIRGKFGIVISEAKENPNFNEKEATKFIWRNAFRFLPLLDWNENPKELNEVDLAKENQILVHYIFYSIDSILFRIKNCQYLIDAYGNYNLSLCQRNLKAKFGDYHHIFFGDSSFSGLVYPISLLYEIIEKVLGEEKAIKYERTIKYELGLRAEPETFDMLDCKDKWGSFIEYLKMIGCEYWANFVEKLFENNFELSEEEEAKMRKRVVISRALSRRILDFNQVAPANEVASIIELSESLKFTEKEIGKFISFLCSRLLIHNSSMYEMIRSEMNNVRLPPANCCIDFYIEDYDMAKVEDIYISYILSILFPNLNSSLFVTSSCNDTYSIVPISPKSLLGSLDEYKPNTNEIVHFSSTEKLKSILKEKSLRLYNTHNSDDKSELSNWLDKFNIDSYSIKQETYTASFCDGKILDDSEKAPVMWQEYGRDGKGVVIKFKINKDINDKPLGKNNEAEISGFFLRKVSYEPIPKGKIEEFINKFRTYCKQHKQNVNILGSIIPFAYVTKKKEFEFENEIRLVKINYSSFPIFQKKHTEMVSCDNEEHNEDNCNCLVKYFKVPLFKKEEGKVELIISEIQFGPNLSDEDYQEQKNEIEKIFTETKINGAYPIPVFSKSEISREEYNKAIEKHKQKTQVEEAAILC